MGRSLTYMADDGQTFLLTSDNDPDEWGLFAAETSEGFWHAPKKLLTTTDAYRRGGRAGRTVWEPREFDLVVYTRFSGRGLPEGAFWRAWSTDSEGTLIVSDSESGARKLRVRLREQPKYDEVTEPRLGAWHKNTLPLVALDPFFMGEPIEAEKSVTGAGDIVFPVFYRGDVSSWPVFTCTPGDWSLPQVGGDSVTVKQMPRPFTAFTQPGVETLVDSSGKNLYSYLRWQDFKHPVPSGFSGNLTVRAEQAGSCRLYIPQLYERPWG